jgi:aminoglycoside phosphotransferase (APT) family kinase protein
MARIQDLDKIGEGRVAEVFAWEADQVIKLYRDPKDRISASAEADATMAAVAAGVPAPVCSGTAVVEGRTGVILERLAGPVLGDRVLSGEVDSSMEILSTLHAQVHARSGIGLPSAHHRLAARIARVVPPPHARQVLDRLASLPGGQCVIHGDMHPFNVMGDGDRWLVIDWDAIYSGPAAFEVARTLFLLEEAAYVEGAAIAAIRRRAAAAFLDGYVALRPIDPAEVRAWRLPVLAARLAEGIVEERAYLLAQIEQALAN